MKDINEEKISNRNEYLKEKYGIDGKNSITASLIGILKNVGEKEIKSPSEETVESKMTVTHLKDTANRDFKMKSEEFTDFITQPFGDSSEKLIVNKI